MHHRVLRLLAASFLCAPLTTQASAKQASPIPLDVSQFGAMPDDGVDDTAAIQSALDALVSGGSLHFDNPGVYELSRASMAPNAAALLKLENRSGVTITSTRGVALVLTDYDRSNQTVAYPTVLLVRNCNDFSLSGASADHPLVFDTRGGDVNGNHGLPFVQGTVLGVTKTSATIAVRDPEMFMPTTCVPKVWGAWEVIDGQPGTNADWEGIDMTARAPSNGVQPMTLRFNMQSYKLPHENWSIGSEVVALLNNSSTFVLMVQNCRGTVVLRDLLAHHLPGKFLDAQMLDHVEVTNVDVRPRYDWRLLSISRDGINASAKYLNISDCDVVGAGDDAIVANGSGYGKVSAANTAARTFSIGQATDINKWPALVSPGDVIVLMDMSSMDPASYQWASITQWAINAGPPVEVHYSYTNETAGFAQMLNSGSGAFAFNPSWSIYGATVANCTAENIRGVGITARGINTTIRQCTVTRASTLGIHAGGGMVSQYPWFGQGAPPHNLTIEYCTVDSCGGVHPIALTGSIEIAVANGGFIPQYPQGCFDGPRPFYPTSPHAIQNVTVRGNLITGSRRAAIFAANVGGPSGIQILNNVFVDCGTPNNCGRPEYNTAVVLERCGGGQVQGNMFFNCQNKTMVTNSPNVTVGR
jgi:hypothetical protein